MGKPILGIIGGGQLGSLLSTAAKNIDIKTVIYCDDIDAPAKNFTNEFICGSYDDEEKINEFVSKVDVVTFEFENIPYETLNKISLIKKVLPNPKINKIVQNRLFEKDFINKINIRTTLYADVKNDKDLKSNIKLLPGILKTCTLGYDGKGQFIINSIKDLNNLNIDYRKEYILEKQVKLKKEISVIVARFAHQKYEIYEPIENIHENQILKYSKIPADINEKIFKKSMEWATSIAEELGYIGTLCVEYFIDKNDNLYVNEIAPRVHNSGHLTINSHNISQFENHVRAVCSLEKKETKKLFNAKMINLIGEDISIYKNKKFKENEFFFDYLKKEIKEKRKMGHLTIINK
jgi:5-(carboxyamino)imidazole ribonucleotide synthase